MKKLRRWLRDAPSGPTLPEAAVRRVEFDLLDDHRANRSRLSGISGSTATSIRSALEDAASPRLTGVLGQVLWQVTALLSIIAASAALGALQGWRSSRPEPIEEAAPVLLVAALVCIVLAFGQVWLRARIHDRDDFSSGVLIIIAVFLAWASIIFILRVFLNELDNLNVYSAIAAVALGAIGAQLGAARYARRKRKLLNREDAPPRLRVAEPRPSARRIERIVRRREKEVRALLATVPAGEHEKLRATRQRSLDELHRLGILDDDDLAAAGSAELGMATIQMVADRARRGVLEFGLDD